MKKVVSFKVQSEKHLQYFFRGIGSTVANFDEFGQLRLPGASEKPGNSGEKTLPDHRHSIFVPTT